MSKGVNISLRGTTMKKVVKEANNKAKLHLNDSEFEKRTISKLFSDSDLLDVLSALSKV